MDTTSGRIATDPYSWMQSVHWVGGSGLYTPSRQHGPKWGPTTVQIAQEISALAECRPSVGYLARKLGLSERTVKYHLDMLREAGLLAYRSKGTRVSRGVNRASVYERVIPVEFDEALGIRTVLRDATAPAYTRVPVGIAEEGRKLIGKLAKQAARKVRRKRAKRTRSQGERCTPMQVRTSATSTTGTTPSPSEAKLASGRKSSPTQQQKQKRLNRVGRRYQLAGELIAQVSWLGAASRPRIAWIVRHVADAGWTALEVQAVAEQDAPLTAADVRRCSGMLAHRLKGVHQLYPAKEQRARLVEHWRESRAAEHARHEAFDDTQAGPARPSLQRLLADAHARIAEQAAADATVHTSDDDCDLEDLDRATVLRMRADAEADHDLIHTALEVLGEQETRRLYTNRLVDLALRTAAHTPAAF
jgi:DNA-binding transcriptional ArsR family regulator